MGKWTPQELVSALQQLAEEAGASSRNKRLNKSNKTDQPRATWQSQPMVKRPTAKRLRQSSEERVAVSIWTKSLQNGGINATATVKCPGIVNWVDKKACRSCGWQVATGGLPSKNYCKEGPPACMRKTPLQNQKRASITDRQ
eukprot:48197-Amphidinium_carterae.1